MNFFENNTLNIFSTVIVFIIGLYLLIVALMYLFQSKLVFFPSSDISVTPAYYNIEFEDVFFKSSDGEELHGWFVPVEKEAPVVLFCHGNAGNISGRLETIRIIHELGLNMFIFDYRGYGKSSGSPSEIGTYHDVTAAWNYLENGRNFTTDNIILFGRSLGSGPALFAAVKNPPAMLIIESGFTSVPDVAADVYPILPVRILSRIKYNNIERIKNINCPVLIIHSPDDNLIRYHHGRNLYEAAREPKKFLEIRGDHNDGFIVSGSVYSQGLREFIAEYSAR